MNPSDQARPVPLNEQHLRWPSPADSILEIPLAPTIAVTIVDSLSITIAGDTEVRTVMLASLGCNVA